MIELNVYISGDSNSQEFRVKLAEIRTFIMEKLANEDVIGLEIRAFDTTRTRYSPAPRIQYSSPVPRMPYNYPGRNPVSLLTTEKTEEPTDELAAAQSGPESYILRNHEDAEKVLEKMLEIIDAYQVVTVHDLREMCGLSYDATDLNKGWTDLTSAKLRQVRDGWVIDFPPLAEIN